MHQEHLIHDARTYNTWSREVYWSQMTNMHGVLKSHNLCMVYWSHMTIMHITLFRGYSQIYHNCRAATVN